MMEQQQREHSAKTVAQLSSEQQQQPKDDCKQRDISSPTSSMQDADEASSVKSDDKSEDKKRSADQAELPEQTEEEEEGEDYVLDQNRFPDKVRYLLDEQVALNAIWWLPEGDALAVNKDAFSMQLLIRHFRGNKFSSVTRNFNRWGFRRVPEERVPDGVLGYTHDMFQRDRKGLLRKMKKEVYVKKEKDPNKESGDEGDKPRPKKKQKTIKKVRDGTSAGLGSAAQMSASHMIAAASHMSPTGLGLGMARAAAPSAQGRSYSPDLHSRLLADLSASSGMSVPSLRGAGTAGLLRESLAMPPSSALDAHGLSIQRLFEQNQADALASLQSERSASAASSGMPSYAALAMAHRLRTATGTTGLSAATTTDPFRDTPSSLASLLQRTPAGSSASAQALPPSSALQSLLMDRRDRANQDAVLQQLARQRQLEALQHQQRRESANETPPSRLADLLSSRSVLPDQLLSNPSASAGLNNPDLLGRSLLDARRRALEAEHREAVLMAAAAGRRPQAFSQQDLSLRNASVRAPPPPPRDLAAAAEEQKELQQQDLIQQMLGVQGVGSLGGGGSLRGRWQREPEEHKRLG